MLSGVWILTYLCQRSQQSKGLPMAASHTSWTRG